MKKILLRAPDSKEDIVGTFPLIHKLKESFPDCQISIITEPEQSYLYSFLGFKVFAFELPIDKNSILGIHHFSYNLNDVFNVDLFFDLQGGFKSSFLGYAFKAKKRVGYAEGLNKLWLNQKIEKPVMSLKKDKYFLNLLEKFSECEFLPTEVFSEQSETPVVEDFFGIEKESFFLFAIEDLKNPEADLDMWVELIKPLKDYKIVFWGYEGAFDFRPLLEKIGEGYDFHVFQESDPLYFASLVLKSRGVFTDEKWLGVLASYFMVESFIFTEEISTVPYVENFKLSANIVETKNKNITKVLTSDDSEVIESSEQFVDFLFQKLNL